MKLSDYANLLTGIIFHPAVTFRTIKRNREKFSWLFVVITFILFIALFIVSRVFVHFPFQTPDVRGSYFIIEVAQVLVPLVTWGFAAYLMSSIMDGEMKLKEFMVSTAFSLLPATILLAPITLMSYLLATDQSFFYYGAITVVLVWTVLLLLGSFKVLNNYEAWPFIKGVFGALICMIVIWCIIFLLYAIVTQAIGVFTSFFRELSLLNA